jgi:hypothetical protein
MRLIAKAGFYYRTCADLKELLFGKSLECVGDASRGGVGPSAVTIELLVVYQYKGYLQSQAKEY